MSRNTHRNEHYNKRKPFGRSYYDKSRVFTMNDDFAKELLKNDIDIEKWYHKLLTGNYYDKNGDVFYKQYPIIAKLASEYSKAMNSKSVNSMLLVKRELFNHINEQKWIHEYLSGNIFDKNSVPLVNSSQHLIELSKRYMEIYDSAVQNT